MISRISYAPISEAWGDTGVHSLAPPIPNVYKEPAPPQPQSSSVPHIRRVLLGAYMRHGIGGVMPYLDPAIVRDLKKTSVYAPKKGGVFQDENMLLFLLLALFAILMIR